MDDHPLLQVHDVFHTVDPGDPDVDPGELACRAGW
jgi:hypothetical protein